ncbi:MAG: tautomerase family protein [Candidatus Nitrosopolaris sp.]
MIRYEPTKSSAFPQTKTKIISAFNTSNRSELDYIKIIYNLRTQLTIMPVIQITISQGRSVEQKRELVKVLTMETARIMKTEQEKIRILIYEVSKENWYEVSNNAIDISVCCFP